MEIGAAVACSVVLHGAFMAYGSWQDSTMAVKYTDIDYWVISDAAKLLSVGKSPFDRPTYRYTPLLAALLVPNNFYGENFGKFIFSALDIFCMLLIYSLLRKQSVPNRKSALISSLIFGCNPLVITVSTRGNAESLVCLLSLLTIWLLSARKRAMAAICVGFGIHTKLFPVLYLPSILVFMGVFPGQSRSAQATYILPSTPLKQDDQQKKKQRVIDIKWKHIQFVVMTISTFLFCSAITFHFFGHKGIHESILYHVSRKDHRHNFSPYWLMFYYNATLKLPDYAISLLPFIPQALLSLYIAYGYGKKDLCFAVFLQTFVFVTMNKVCTSQVLLLNFYNFY